MSELYLSIVIPAYNEEKRLKETLPKITSYLKDQIYSSEVILVDDGSSDETVRIARAGLSQTIHKVIENKVNRGKGFSVRSGMLSATGQYVFFMDADLSTPIEEVGRFLKLFESGEQCIIGSRALDESNLQVRQSGFREFMGRVFNLFARTFCFRGIHDSQCGFKAFQREVAQAVFSRQKLEGFSFDAEIIYIAQKLGYHVREEPVTWSHSPVTRVNLMMDPIRMFVDLVRIRWLQRDLKKK